MKRVLIIGIVLVAIWLIFNKANENQVEEPVTEETQTEEVIEEKQPESKEVEKEEPKESNSAETTTDKEVKEEATSEEKTTTKTTSPVVKPTPTEETVTKTSSEKPADYAINDRVKVYMYEWGIDLSTTNVLPGNVEFEVVNNGQFTHHFSVKGVQNFGKVVPGETRVFMAQLGEGSFEILSPRNIDVENGMSETLHVGE